MMRLFEPEPEASGSREAEKKMSRPKQSTLVIRPEDDPGGKTPFERFDNIMKRILATPKEEVDRRMATNAKPRRKAKRPP
jgi:hypothetical protein